MSVFSWLRRDRGAAAPAAAAPAASAQAAAADPKMLEEIFLQIAGAAARSGVLVTQQRALQIAAVYACVRAITDPVSMLPLQLIRKADGKRLPATDLKLYTLLYERPNEWQTSFEWREMKQRDVLLAGNAFSYIVRGYDRQPQELLRLHPNSVQPEQDDRTLEVYYWHTKKNGQRVKLKRSEVLHIRGLGDDGIRGQNPIQFFRETLGDAIAVQEHGSRFWSNGAKPLSVLEQSKDIEISDPDRKAIKEDFETMYSGGENAYRSALLPPGFTFKQVSISHEDAQFLETRKFSRSEVASIFRVPPHKIGDLEKATFSNIEHQALEFVTDSLTPWLVRWEQAIARDLLDNDPTLFARFNVNALLRGDFKSRQEGLQIQRRNGVVNADEWRELEDMNPRDDLGGKEYIVEGNMARQTGGLAPEHQPAPAKRES